MIIIINLCQHGHVLPTTRTFIASRYHYNYYFVGLKSIYYWLESMGFVTGFCHTQAISKDSMDSIPLLLYYCAPSIRYVM